MNGKPFIGREVQHMVTIGQQAYLSLNTPSTEKTLNNASLCKYFIGFQTSVLLSLKEVEV
jgi:hypothetical protein